MNTTKIGDKFEERVFKIFRKELQDGRLPLNSAQSKIYRKRPYFSTDRNANIIFDISIESFVSGQDNWSMLTLIECKKYSKPVPVDDVEEFYSKLQQVAGAKGIVVSSNSFQEGAMTYARSKKIALVRILPTSKMKWILTRISNTDIYAGYQKEVDSAIHEALTTESFSHDYFDFFGLFGDRSVHSLSHLFDSMFHLMSSGRARLPTNSHPQHDSDRAGNRLGHIELGVPFVSEKEIQRLCHDVLKRVHIRDCTIPLQDIAAMLEKEHKIRIEYRDTLGRDRNGYAVLGKIYFDPTIIYISKPRGSEELYRQKFTLAHELGHYLLGHAQYMRRESYTEGELDIIDAASIYLEDIRRMEWQANNFASNLLLPREMLLEEFNYAVRKLGIRDKGHGKLFVDNQACNIDNFYRVTERLKKKFHVSRKAIEIALKKLSLLNDSRSASLYRVMPTLGFLLGRSGVWGG